ncbi:MAG: hypothetical protein V4693_06000 [Pseudomonadota bacterium]
MVYQFKKVSLSRIYLDNENPRHEAIQNEAEIIAHLIAGENVKALARDIADKGQLNPLDRLGLAPHPLVKGAFITAEGNRRICALKLLGDPDKAGSEADKKYFRRLSAKLTTPLTEIDSVIFANLEKARPWVSLRHEGEQGGIGTKSWTVGQTARFNSKGTSKSLNPNIQAMLLVDYARAQSIMRDDQIDKLGITTLTRYLSNPVFRDAIGLNDNKTLSISVPQSEFNRAVTRFFDDVLNEASGVSSRTSVDERKAYANRLRADGTAPATREYTTVDLSQPPPSVEQPPLTTIASVAKRNNRNPSLRAKVVPSHFAVHINDSILKRLYDELRSLNAEEFPFAAVYLIRAVIERAITLHLKQNGVAPPGELHMKIAKLVPLLETAGMTDRELKVMRTMANDKESRYSPDSIGHFVHGGQVPTRKEVISLWDSLEGVLKKIFDTLK